MERRKFVGSDCLILSKPYILAIYGQDEEKKLKSLAILDFSSWFSYLSLFKQKNYFKA